MLLWIIPFEMTTIVNCLYFTFIYMLYNTTFTVLYIPYNFLSANMTSDYDERTSLNAVRLVMGNIGILLRDVIFSLLAEGQDCILYATDSTEKTVYILSGMIFGVVAMVNMLICTMNVKERVDENSDNTYNFTKNLKQFFTLK